MSVLKLKSSEENSGKMNEDLDDVISEKVKIASAKQELRLEKILTFKFQEMIENKMADVEIKTETKLLSKYEKDFKNLEGKLRKQMKSTDDFHRNLVTNNEFLKLKDDFKNLKVNVNKDLKRQSEDLKKDLKESSKHFIEGAFEEKCEDFERKSFNNLQGKFQRYSEDIKNDLSRDVDFKLKDAKEILKNELKNDFFKQNEEFKKILQETSKAYIEGVVEIKCEEIEKKSLKNLTVECKKYSEEIKKNLSHDFELKLKKDFANERTILFNEIESKVNMKVDEIKLIEIQELNEELRKELQNETQNSERKLNEKYELEKLKMEDDFKKITSQVDGDIHSLSRRLDVLMPRSFKVIWEIQDFKHQLSDNNLSIESEAFQLYEIECKVKFIFEPHFMDFEVKYLDQPSDKIIPFNGHHRITFILHDQVDKKSHNDYIRIFEPTFGDRSNRTLRFHFWFTTDDLSFLHSRWLKNGKIPVNVILEPLNQIIALEPRHYGHVIWKIHHFKDVCECHQHHRQYSWSETFYSSEKGYRMKGSLFVDDKVHFSLYFLKGPWDKELPIKFQHRTTVTLISQKDPRELRDKTISEERKFADCDYICDFPKADLENYVKNDSLIICLKVEAF